MVETINQRIYRYRKQLGFTQKDVAQMLEMQPSTYAQMERKGKISSDVLIKLSQTFDISVLSLLFGENVHESQIITTYNATKPNPKTQKEKFYVMGVTQKNVDLLKNIVYKEENCRYAICDTKKHSVFLPSALSFNCIMLCQQNRRVPFFL